MRSRIAVLASLAATAATVAVAMAPGVAAAAPKHNRGLTINVTPNPINAGDPVLIYGQLSGTDIAGRTIVLYRHISGSGQGYSVVQHTTTNSFGFYEFTRADGVVNTNRSWFVRQAGAPTVHSRTVFERVAALVSLTPDHTTADTGKPVTFSGHVTPNHAFERVLLQQQIGASDDWRTIKTGRLGPGSSYSIRYSWRVPGVYSLRAVFTADGRNLRGESDPVAVTIEQAQVPDFTINSSSPVINEGDHATLYGVLDMPGTTTPEPSTSVTLWTRGPDQTKFHALTSTTTDGNGKYGFTVQPAEDVIYQVRTTMPPRRRSAALFEGVRDVITLAESSSSVFQYQPVVFAGAVTPDKAGHVVYLQRLGADGDWHTVARTRVNSASTYQFTRRLGEVGTFRFRTRILGDEHNVGAASAPVSLTVNLLPVASLPQAT